MANADIAWGGSLPKQAASPAGASMEKRWRRVTSGGTNPPRQPRAAVPAPSSCKPGRWRGLATGKAGGRGRAAGSGTLTVPDPLGWNLELAADAVISKRQFDLAAELVGQQFAKDARAVARWVSGWHGRAAKFPPFDQQVRQRGAVRAPAPFHSHPP